MTNTLVFSSNKELIFNMSYLKCHVWSFLYFTSFIILLAWYCFFCSPTFIRNNKEWRWWTNIIHSPHYCLLFQLEGTWKFCFMLAGKFPMSQCHNNQMRRKKLVNNKVIKVLCRIGSETLRFAEGEELLLFDFLTNVSHYDSRQAPTCLDGKPQSPLVVRTSMFVYFIGNFDAQNLEFETHLLFRHRWRVSNA